MGGFYRMSKINPMAYKYVNFFKERILSESIFNITTSSNYTSTKNCTKFTWLIKPAYLLVLWTSHYHRLFDVSHSNLIKSTSFFFRILNFATLSKYLSKVLLSCDSTFSFTYNDERPLMTSNTITFTNFTKDVILNQSIRISN